jgi:hypothetical protein
MIAGIPIMALFVLFDLVIHNPRHIETGNNLALLDMAGGHFSRIQYASNGTLPGSLITDFAYIAREYANNFRRLEAEASRKESAVLPSTPLTGATKACSTPYLVPPAQTGLSTDLPAPRVDPVAVAVSAPLRDFHFYTEAKICSSFKHNALILHLMARPRTGLNR